MNHLCSICGGSDIETIESFAELPRVTSDCKPWPAGGQLAVCNKCGFAQKFVDGRFTKEVKQIYDSYDIYSLSQGVEQKVYAVDGSATPRSRKLIEFVLENARLKNLGKLIDIGCGNGEALANFSAVLPGWSLYGSELSEKHSDRLKEINNFVTLYTDLRKDLSEQFDLVTMIYALEHISEPQSFLDRIIGLFSSEGRLLIEVPNVETSPFDLLIADHCSHFTPAHLAYAVSRAGFSVSHLRDDVCPKEITLLASMGREERPIPSRDSEFIRCRVNWLGRTLELARIAMADARCFGIFGTSIAGMWLYGSLSNRIEFFVDEDVSRVGGHYEGRPIISPDDVPDGATIFVPMGHKAAEALIARLAVGGSQAEWILPPTEIV